LISKYGQPTDGESIPLGQTEADFSWILPDAANSSTMSKIDAGIVPLGGTDPRSHLTMELVPFVNPHTPQPSAAMEQPKL
jgi:hypothetical protein